MDNTIEKCYLMNNILCFYSSHNIINYRIIGIKNKYKFTYNIIFNKFIKYVLNFLNVMIEYEIWN